MRKSGFYPKLAWGNIVRNRQFYVPYLLTLGGTAAAFYIIGALAGARDLPVMNRYIYLSMFMTFGLFVIAVFAVIFLGYTNSFLMKRRRKELGLYNVLGMGKRNIARMLGMETVYTALIGIGGGILAGLLLQKLVTLLLCRIMAFHGTGFSFYVSREGILTTIALFTLILLGNLLVNLIRVGRQSPMELMRSASAGEREPKSNWPMAILGILALGGGYAIAVFTNNAGMAFALYFPAVILVIIGTYALFTAVSIVVLKALRKNKRYYYQPRHFIGVSSMLYRMRRNAVGLANICILSTMVLVMVSGTLALYLNSQQTLEKQFPAELSVPSATRRIRRRPSMGTPSAPGSWQSCGRRTVRRRYSIPTAVLPSPWTRSPAATSAAMSISPRPRISTSSRRRTRRLSPASSSRILLP